MARGRGRHKLAVQCGVVLQEALRAAKNHFGPACEGLVVQLGIWVELVQVPLCQHFPSVLAVVCNPIAPLVVMGCP